MKKNLMIFAASTMLLFAACNKEDNNVYTINGDKITFGIGMDEPQSADKQTFVGMTNRIWFDAGDQIFVNNERCLVNPEADPRYSASSSSSSAQGRVTASISSTGSYDFIYPAGPIQFEGGQYKATFPSQVQAVNIVQNNHLDGNFPTWPDYISTPIWPMYYGIPDISNQNSQIKLLNACSFLAPAFIYGTDFANAVFGPFVSGTEYGVNAVPPALNITEVKIKSNIPLYGPAHLDYTDRSNPQMVMDATMPNCGYQILHVQMGGELGTPINYSNNMANWATPGVATVAPREASDITLRMLSSFWVNLGTDAAPDYYYLCYVSDSKTVRASLERNIVNLLRVNFNTIGDQNDPAGWNFVTPYTDYVAHHEGIIRIANGYLFVTGDDDNFRARIAAFLNDPQYNFEMLEH